MAHQFIFLGYFFGNILNLVSDRPSRSVLTNLDSEPSIEHPFFVFFVYFSYHLEISAGSAISLSFDGIFVRFLLS